MYKLGAISLLLFASVCLQGQDMGAANKALKTGHYLKALKIYDQIYAKDSENKELNFNMGVCNFQLKRYDKAEEHFLNSSSAVSLELFRYKAAVAHANMKFKKAINFYNAYKLIAGSKELTNDEINREVEKVKYAEAAMLAQRNVLIQNFTDINTEQNELYPHIIADETRLLFCRSDESSNLDEHGNMGAQALSTVKKGGLWEQSQTLNKAINASVSNHIVGLSTDGQTLFLERDGDIYECKMGLDDWEEPVKMDESINSKYNESGVTITLDDKVLYFVSDRPGGFGGKDIYKCLRLPNGKWSRALNLGPIVNSPYDEESPFIHSDKKTLYFSSTGHQNMGGYDVFKTVNEGAGWSEPENLKAPVNTTDDDLHYTVVGSGKVAYVAGYRPEGKGGSDVYKIVLKDEFAQFHVLKAVTMGKGDKAIAAKVTLIDNKTKKVHGIYKANEKTGKFIMLIDPEGSYNILVEAEGFQSYSAKLKFDVNSTDRMPFQLEAK